MSSRLDATSFDRRKEDTMPSSVRSEPFSSRITRPREKMRTRSHSPASSIASEELMTKATPWFALARMAR